MTTQGPNTLSFRWNLGMRDTAIHEDVVPMGERPELVESINTRFTRTYGVGAKSPAYASLFTPTTRCGGIVPSGAGSWLACHKLGNARFIGSNVASPIVNAGNTNVWDSAWTPYKRTGGGIVPNGDSYASPATVVDSNGYTWFAMSRPSTLGGAVPALYVSVLDTSGRLIASGTVNTSLSAASQPWVGLTARSDGYVVAWWIAGGVIKAQKVGLNTSTLSLNIVGAPNSIYTPLTVTAGSISVHADGGTTHYLACVNAAVATSLSVSSVNTDTWAVTTDTRALGANVLNTAVRHISWNGDSYVAAACSLNGGTSRNLLYKNGTYQWDVAGYSGGAATRTTVACTFWSDGATLKPVYACTLPSGGFATVTNSGTEIAFRTVAAGATDGSPVVMPWKGLISNGAWDRDAESGYVFPLFAFQNIYNIASSADATSIDFVSDPAVELYRIGQNASTAPAISMVGRYSVDSAVIYPAVSSGAPVVNSNNLEVSSSSVVFSYLESRRIRDSADAQGYAGRYVVLSTAAFEQPTYALDSKGLALIGPGPACWDGVRAREWSPVAAPKIQVQAAGGNVAIGSAGTYLFAVVVQWKDATGQFHRSPPSNIVSIALVALDQPRAFVSLPVSFQSPNVTSDPPQYILYASEPNGTVLYAQNYACTGTTTYFAQFYTINPPTVGALNPPIYTDGSPGYPLPAQCPPSFDCVAIVNDRAWGYDGERVWYSKTREDGYAFEFSSSLTMPPPSAAGDVVAIVDMEGQVALLCKNGVWVISGPGPDNSLTSAGFNGAEQIADVPCTHRLSVVKTPQGVFFRSNDRFAQLYGGARLLDQMDASAAGTLCAVEIREAQEVMWASSTGRHIVYNYGAGKFSVWSTDTLAAVEMAARDPAGALRVSVSGGPIGSLDPSTTSTTAQTSYKTGWIPLGGQEDDNSVAEVRIRARRQGAHGLSIKFYGDYSNVSYTTRTIPAATITSIVRNGEYTISIAPKLAGQSRAVRIEMLETDSSGEAFQPVSCTIVYGKDKSVLFNGVLQGARF